MLVKDIVFSNFCQNYLKGICLFHVDLILHVDSIVTNDQWTLISLCFVKNSLFFVA